MIGAFVGIGAAIGCGPAGNSGQCDEFDTNPGRIPPRITCTPDGHGVDTGAPSSCDAAGVHYSTSVAACAAGSQCGGGCYANAKCLVACTNDAACASPTTCVRGFCQAPADCGQMDAPCSGDVDCAPGLACKPGFTNSSTLCVQPCVDDTACAASSRRCFEGACIQGEDAGSTCTVDAECALGLTCAPSSAGGKACAKP